MNVYRKIGISAAPAQGKPGVFVSPGKWNLAPFVADVRAAIGRGEGIIVCPNPWFPASWTLTGEGAYGEYQDGCWALKFQGTVLIHIVDYPLLWPYGPEPMTTRAPSGSPDPVDPRPQYARKTEFWCQRGNAIGIIAPGVMRNAPGGYFAGIPGGGLPSHGGHVYGTLDAARVGVKEQIGLDGSFIYQHDGSAGDMDSFKYNLIVIGPDGKPTYQQPFDDVPYEDHDTWSYCAIGKVPALYPPYLFEFGYEVGKALLPFADHIYAVEAPVNEPEYQFWPQRLAEGSPDLVALIRQIIHPFADGIDLAMPPRGVRLMGPHTGDPNVLKSLSGLIDATSLDVYRWAPEKATPFAEVIATHLDWFADIVDKSKPVIITELGDLSESPSGVGNVGVDSMNVEKWTAVYPKLQERKWITAAFNGATGLIEEIMR